MIGHRRARATVLLVSVLAQVVLLAAPPTLAQTAVKDYPIPGGWFFTQESRDPAQIPPFRGYTVVDDADAAFWTEFRRYGGVDVLGYPVSRRYRYPNASGFLHQAFQRGILQWRPDRGQADLANVFEYFTEQGKDDALELVGIPKPNPPSQLPFQLDAERRMSWLTEPRFLARYLFNPIEQTPFDTQDSAWQFFGLPQGFSERPVYFRERASGKFGAPLYLPYLAQRYQKAALQLFFDDVPNDPTIVPGDGRIGCVAITASGRLARRLGAGKIIPGQAIVSEPPEIPARVHFIPSIPPLTAPGQRFIQFELVGTGFDSGEAVTIRMTPINTVNLGGGAVLGDVAPVLTVRVDATDPDGSFDQLITVRTVTYQIEMTGETSKKTLDVSQDPTINLTVPTIDTQVQSKATFC